MLYRDILTVDTPGRGVTELTSRVDAVVARSGASDGLCHLFVHHTSASLMVCENADPDVLRDMQAFMARLVPDGDRLFVHTAEGPDDMPAHVRSVLTHTSITVPVQHARCALGTWQGIFLWEHRLAAHRRRVTITVQALSS